MFSCEFWKISKNTFFTEHLLVTASVNNFFSKGKLLIFDNVVINCKWW